MSPPQRNLGLPLDQNSMVAFLHSMAPQAREHFMVGGGFDNLTPEAQSLLLQAMRVQAQPSPALQVFHQQTQNTAPAVQPHTMSPTPDAHYPAPHQVQKRRVQRPVAMEYNFQVQVPGTPQQTPSPPAQQPPAPQPRKILEPRLSRNPPSPQPQHIQQATAEPVPAAKLTEKQTQQLMAETLRRYGLASQVEKNKATNWVYQNCPPQTIQMMRSRNRDIAILFFQHQTKSDMLRVEAQRARITLQQEQLMSRGAFTKAENNKQTGQKRKASTVGDGSAPKKVKTTPGALDVPSARGSTPQTGNKRKASDVVNETTPKKAKAAAVEISSEYHSHPSTFSPGPVQRPTTNISQTPQQPTPQVSNNTLGGAATAARGVRPGSQNVGQFGQEQSIRPTSRTSSQTRIPQTSSDNYYEIHKGAIESGHAFLPKPKKQAPPKQPIAPMASVQRNGSHTSRHDVDDSYSYYYTPEQRMGAAPEKATPPVPTTQGATTTQQVAGQRVSYPNDDNTAQYMSNSSPSFYTPQQQQRMPPSSQQPADLTVSSDDDLVQQLVRDRIAEQNGGNTAQHAVNAGYPYPNHYQQRMSTPGSRPGTPASQTTHSVGQPPSHYQNGDNAVQNAAHPGQSYRNSYQQAMPTPSSGPGTPGSESQVAHSAVPHYLYQNGHHAAIPGQSLSSQQQQHSTSRSSTPVTTSQASHPVAQLQSPYQNGHNTIQNTAYPGSFSGQQQQRVAESTSRPNTPVSASHTSGSVAQSQPYFEYDYNTIGAAIPGQSFSNQQQQRISAPPSRSSTPITKSQTNHPVAQSQYPYQNGNNVQNSINGSQSWSSTQQQRMLAPPSRPGTPLSTPQAGGHSVGRPDAASQNGYHTAQNAVNQEPWYYTPQQGSRMSAQSEQSMTATSSPAVQPAVIQHHAQAQMLHNGNPQHPANPGNAFSKFPQQQLSATPTRPSTPSLAAVHPAILHQAQTLKSIQDNALNTASAGHGFSHPPQNSQNGYHQANGFGHSHPSAVAAQPNASVSLNQSRPATPRLPVPGPPLSQSIAQSQGRGYKSPYQGRYPQATPGPPQQIQTGTQQYIPQQQGVAPRQQYNAPVTYTPQQRGPATKKNPAPAKHITKQQVVAPPRQQAAPAPAPRTFEPGEINWDTVDSAWEENRHIAIDSAPAVVPEPEPVAVVEVTEEVWRSWGSKEAYEQGLKRTKWYADKAAGRI